MPAGRTSARAVAALSVGALVAGGIAISAPASGASKKVQTRSASYQYGNWAQPGDGFKNGSDDTMSQVYQLTWRGAFPDLDDTVGPVYAAGTFIKSGSTTINRVAQWNGTAWTTLPGDDTGIAAGVTQSVPTGKGYTKPGVYGLVLGGDDSLYAGGQFWGSDDSLNNVGQWNGTDWVRMGNGLRVTTDGDVVQDVVIGNDFIGGDDLNYADDTVYALGGFVGTCATLACTATGVTAAGIAQYSHVDDTWYPMGNGTMTSGYGITPQAYAGAYIDDTLYVGGSFVTVGGVSARNIAQWSPSSGGWLPVAAGIADGGQYDGVFSMAVHPITKDLYVGGQFAQPAFGTSAMGGIVKWDYEDDTWYAVGTGLTGGNTDDISFSADGKTMWIGSWASAPTVGGTAANGIATLTSEDFDDTAATTISGTWGYLKSSGVIGVSGPSNASLNQTSTRAVLAQPSGAVLAGGNFHTAGAVSAGRVALFTPGAEPSPYDPVYPPGVPTDVVATGGWNKVTVEWKAPTYTGSYPITNYLVQASPGGNVCITRLSDPKQNQCTYTSLTPGTKYTFRVQGLNGGGWGDRSAASNVASPQNLKITSHNRKKLNFFLGGGSEVTAAGVAPGFAPGTKIVPWVKIGDRAWESAATSGLTVSSVERFSWKRKFNKKQNSTPISVRFEIGGNFSNTVLLRPVR